MKKTFKRAVIILILTALTLTYLPLTASARTIRWDGKSGLQSGNIYFIDNELTLTSNLVIPEGATLNIRENGVLYLRRGMTLVIRGSLWINEGAKVEMRDAVINLRAPGKITIKGSFYQFADTTLNNLSEIEVFSKGFFQSSGILNVFADSGIRSTGEIILTGRSTATVSGEVENLKAGTLTTHGLMTITSRGIVSSYGSFVLTSTATIKNNGIFTLFRNSKFHWKGKLENTETALFNDYRNTQSSGGYSHLSERMTAAILLNEPRYEIRGIDVSYANPVINWEQVAAAGIEFAMIRAARGTASANWPMREDTHFKQHIEGAQAAGLEVGVYFYSYARTVDEARKEAEFLVNVIKDYTITYPVVFDLEDEIHRNMSKALLTDMTEVFFEVLAANGYYPMLYSYKSFLENRIDPWILETYAVWLAHINVRETSYGFPFHMWQTSHTGRVSGISGNVDLNISYYDFPQILRKHRLNKLK